MDHIELDTLEALIERMFLCAAHTDGAAGTLLYKGANALETVVRELIEIEESKDEN